MFMDKEFKHKEGTIKVTQQEDSITVNPLEKEGIIEVNNSQSKESILQEVEDKLNLMYTGYPTVVKEFIKWLEDVVWK